MLSYFPGTLFLFRFFGWFTHQKHPKFALFFFCVYPLCSWTVTSTNTGTSEETNMLEGFCICKQKMQAKIIGLLRGGSKGRGFPNIP